MTHTHRIFFIMGKSSSGKDTIFMRLRRRHELRLTAVIPYTTRPIREGEEDGREYFFADETIFQGHLAAGRVIEERSYDTFHGIWRYFTVDDGQFDFAADGNDRLMIGTPASFAAIGKYFPKSLSTIVPIMIELDDGIRLARALGRERSQEYPKYEEMCRRYLADNADFAAALITAGDDWRRFDNQDLDECESRIIEYISQCRTGGAGLDASPVFGLAGGAHGYSG